MAKRAVQNIKMISVDGLPAKNGVTEIEVSGIRAFKDYPFKVADDDRMHELVESILTNGVLIPVTVRTVADGSYEMISGHRRLFAVKQIGLEKIPAVIKEYDDDEAIMAMVDSNLQREEILPSEKAFAYKMRYEAMRRCAGRHGNKPAKAGKKYQTDIALADEVGESRNQLHRFLRLTELIPSILDLVDKKALAMVTAVEVSFLKPKVQEMLYAYMTENGICKAFQIYAIRDYLRINETITRQELIRILNENAPKDESNRFQQLTITKKKLQEYFPVYYTRTQMENVLYKLLREWKEENVGEKRVKLHECI